MYIVGNLYYCNSNMGKMIKCQDKGIFTCIGRNGIPKKRFNTSEEAIHAAKKINEKNPNTTTKLVGYKCTNCHGYHLTTHFKRIRNNK